MQYSATLTADGWLLEQPGSSHAARPPTGRPPAPDTSFPRGQPPAAPGGADAGGADAGGDGDIPTAIVVDRPPSSVPTWVAPAAAIVGGLVVGVGAAYLLGD